MESLFENTYIRDKKVAKEIYGYFYFRRKFYIIVYIMLVIAFAANLVTAICGYSYNLPAFILIPLLFALPFYSYFRQVSILVKRDKEAHGDVVELNTVVTEDFIQITVLTSVSKVEFDKIKSVIQTKNLILLRTKANMLVIFQKDGFTKGDKDEFVSFLKNKGIKVKGK